MPRLMLIPIAVLLSSGAVLLGPGEVAADNPAVDTAQQGQVQAGVGRFGN